MPKTVPKNSGESKSGGRKRKRESRDTRPNPGGKRMPTPETNRIPSNVSPSVAVASPGTPSSTTSNGRGAATDFMLQALGRIRELQDELDFLQNDPYAEDTDDDDNDEHEPIPGGVIGGRQAEAIGWAVCARETMHFLQREGISPDSPLMVNLRRRLIGQTDDEALSC